MFSPTDRRVGGLRCAATQDMGARGRAGQQRLRDRFEAQVPAEITDPVERAKRAELLRRAYFQQLAGKSAKARRRKQAS